MGFWAENGGTSRKQFEEQRLGGLACTFPPIAKCAMDGAPGRLSVGEKERNTTADPCGMTNKGQATATANAGILRCAQNDKWENEGDDK
jgi:hypothetical protein